MHSLINRANPIIDRSNAIQFNTEIVSFFEEVRWSMHIRDIHAICSSGRSFQHHVLHMVRGAHDPVNLWTFFHRFGKTHKKRFLRWAEYLYSEIFHVLLTEKKQLLLEKNWQARDIWDIFYGFQNCSNIPPQIFQNFIVLISSIKIWDAHSITNILYGLQNCSYIPPELFQNIIKIIPTIKNWKSRWIWNALYGLQNCHNVSPELLKSFAKIIPTITDWEPQWIWNAFFWISHLEWSEVDELIDELFQKIYEIDMETVGFIWIQSLVIWLNHIQAEIPNFISKKWDSLVEEEWRGHSTITYDENVLSRYLREKWDMDNFEIHQWVYVNGYEVDHIILDTEGNIFAIIESDGSIHNSISKINKDNKRDQFFLNAWVTDLIIRKTRHGCKIVEKLVS